MFYSEQLLSREGPLAHVWLAANLERKLTKQQLLTASIPESSEAIVSSSNGSLGSQYDQVEPLALRLTGTLLYGIVRIYSRKAKYLLDDVSDALLRLKTAFKTSNSIILPSQATIIPSVKQVTLQDTVTGNDLLWQEPLNLDDDPEFDNTEENANSFDNSLELGRGPVEFDELAGNNDNLQLDFDLGEPGENDMSIELGRDRESALEDQSVLPDLTFGDFEEERGPAPDFGEFNDFGSAADFDMNISNTPNDQPQTPNGSPGDIQLISSPSEQPWRHKKRTNKFAQSDVVRTSKRRLIVDETTELSSAQIKDQIAQSETINMTPVEQTLEERYHALAKNSVTSRLHFDLPTSHPSADDQLPRDIADLDPDHEAPNVSFELPNASLNFDMVDQEQAGEGLEFDFLPTVEVPPEMDYESQRQQQKNKEEVSQKIQEIVSGQKQTTFSYIVENNVEEIVSPKKHATNCFFELLVMASANKIELKQEALFSEITVVSRI